MAITLDLPNDDESPWGQKARTAWSVLADGVNEINETLEPRIAEAVETAVEDMGPGSTAAHARVETTLTFTSDVYPGVFLPGLSTGPILGTGRPMEISLYVPSLQHSVASAMVAFQLSADYSLSPLNTLVGMTTPPVAMKQVPLFVTREVVIPEGVTKTWDVYAYADTAGTTTLIGAPYCPIELKVVRR